MKTDLNLTIPMNEFSVDGITTNIITKTFDGKDINLGSDKDPLSLKFKNPLTNELTCERSNLITNFGFNGTALLTPSAFFNSELNINSLPDSLNGELLFIDISSVVECDREYIEKKLKKLNVDFSKKYMILFYTGFMDKLKVDYSTGVPNKLFWDAQSDRPYLTLSAVEYLNEIDISKGYLIDNVSFEANSGLTFNFPVTSLLINHNEKTKVFTPLIYHTIVSKEECEYLKNTVKEIYIEIGNVPSGNISGYSVKVLVK